MEFGLRCGVRTWPVRLRAGSARFDGQGGLQRTLQALECGFFPKVGEAALRQILPAVPLIEPLQQSTGRRQGQRNGNLFHGRPRLSVRSGWDHGHVEELLPQALPQLREGPGGQVLFLQDNDTAVMDRQEQILGLDDALEAVVGELLDGLRPLVKRPEGEKMA